jgi:hypothetical protein
MLVTFFYVDVFARGSKVAYSAKRIDEGWKTDASTILNTFVTSLQKHSPQAEILMLTDDATPSIGVETLRLPGEGLGILALRLRLLQELRSRVPFFHADADVAFFADIAPLEPATYCDVCASTRETDVFAPVASGAGFPEAWLHPHRKDYVNISLLFPFLTGFFYVGSEKYLDKLEQAAQGFVYTDGDLPLWWGDMAAHNWACKNVKSLLVYPCTLVGSGSVPSQKVVFQKGDKNAATVRELAKAADVGVPCETQIVLNSTLWPRREV